MNKYQYYTLQHTKNGQVLSMSHKFTVYADSLEEAEKEARKYVQNTFGYYTTISKLEKVS